MRGFWTEPQDIQIDSMVQRTKIFVDWKLNNNS